jgi:hypothetical protein
MDIIKLFVSNYYAWDHYIYISNYTKLVTSLDAYKVQSQEEEPLITRLESLPMTTMYMWPLCIWFINYQNYLLKIFLDYILTLKPNLTHILHQMLIFNNFKIICILCAIFAIFNFICLYFFYIYIMHCLVHLGYVVVDSSN